MRAPKQLREIVKKYLAKHSTAHIGPNLIAVIKCPCGARIPALMREIAEAFPRADIHRDTGSCSTKVRVTIRVMNQKRRATARGVLQSELAKKVFDRLCALYPDASIFWNTENGEAELGLNPIPASGGFTMPEVTIRIG